MRIVIPLAALILMLLLYIIPPVVILLATFVWKDRWRREAWLPVPVFVAALWFLQVYGRSELDLSGGEVAGAIVISGAAVVYYERLYYLHHREQRAALVEPATSAR